MQIVVFKMMVFINKDISESWKLKFNEAKEEMK